MKGAIMKDGHKSLILAVRDSSQVDGYTHNFYRYPARFSPIFAREAIRTFTKPGELVVDPFVGGGTTLVEACVLGRKSVGIDINSLATFVSSVKTQPLSKDEIEYITNWTRHIDEIVVSKRINNGSFWEINGYLANVDTIQTWRLRNLIEFSISEINEIESETIQNFLRCALLRTGQWALDGRLTIPSINEFRNQFKLFIVDMLGGISEYKSAIDSHCIPEKPKILTRSVIGVEDEQLFQNQKIHLILMSPPYPGVHVLCHRWQIMGRKETPVPYWIANRIDGNGESYYTFGSRGTHLNSKYFDEMEKVFTSLNVISNESTFLVQMVAFSNPKNQLPRYLRMMDKAGFEEIFLTKKQSHKRIWRKVPNRKWHATLQGDTPSSKEVVLIHKKRYGSK